jgi:hypothetical protein
MDYTGRVVKKPFGVGTKSAHDAVMLVTDSGDYVLRRLGGNAFRDPELERLVGHSIRCEGRVHGYTLIMSHWSVLPDT